jgi:hypothetical protein
MDAVSGAFLSEAQGTVPGAQLLLYGVIDWRRCGRWGVQSRNNAIVQRSVG